MRRLRFDGDLLILQADQEMGTGSFITGLNRYTGEVVWMTFRKNRRSWATPIVIDAGGRKELVASGAENVVAYDPRTGRELWRRLAEVCAPVEHPR